MSRRAGRVVRVRVNPRDCMSVVDVVKAAGVYTRGMSFSQVCSIALSTMLETLRQQGVVPDRQGFEYSELMAEFPDQPQVDRARKLAITNAFASVGSEVKWPTVVPAGNLDVTKASKRRRFEELSLKREVDELNFSEAEQQELTRLVQELFFPEESAQVQMSKG